MQEQEQAKPRGVIPSIIGSIGRGLQKGLRSIGIVLAAVLILTMVCINLWIAYIMFAPDTMPKPFYLTYQTEPGQANQGGAKPSTSAQQLAEQSQQSVVPPAVVPKAPSVPLEIKAGQGIMFDTGTKIVNLADPSGRRYIKTNIILEYAPNDITYFLESKEDVSTSGAAGGGEGGAVPVMKYADRFKQELEPKRPLIDDTIITLLSSKNFDQVYSSSGKDLLRKEIMALLNSRMPEYRVIFVYFTEFTVQ
jgi:flagellar FliL protein